MNVHSQYNNDKKVVEMKQKNTALSLVAIGVVSMMGLSGCDDVHSGGVARAPQAVEVGVVTVTEKPLQVETVHSGRVRASKLAEVRPQAGGIIKKRLFDEGSFVKAGQPLYQLDDAQSRAALMTAQATQKKAESALKVASDKARRAESLISAKAVSKEEYDDAKAGLLQARAELDVAKSAVHSAEIDVSYGTIKAPISGWAGRSSVTEGALVTANQADPLVSIQQTDPIHIDVTQPSKNLPMFRQHLVSLADSGKQPNTTVKISFSGEQPKSYQGIVKFVDPAIDPTTDSFITRLEVNNKNALLAPGMYVDTKLVSADLKQAILVPQRGVVRDAKGNATVSVVKDGQIETKGISVSMTVGDSWLVTDGLSIGDKVVVDGIQKIRQGMAVQAVEHKNT